MSRKHRLQPKFSDVQTIIQDFFESGKSELSDMYIGIYELSVEFYREIIDLELDSSFINAHQNLMSELSLIIDRKKTDYNAVKLMLNRIKHSVQVAKLAAISKITRSKKYTYNDMIKKKLIKTNDNQTTRSGR